MMYHSIEAKNKVSVRTEGCIAEAVLFLDELYYLLNGLMVHPGIHYQISSALIFNNFSTTAMQKTHSWGCESCLGKTSLQESDDAVVLAVPV